MESKTKTRNIEIENTPDIEGLSFRGYKGLEEIPAMVDLFNAANKANDVDEVENEDAARIHYSNLRNCNPDKDIIMAEVNGELAAMGRCYWFEITDGPHAYGHFYAAHPNFRGHGIGKTIALWLETRLREIAAEHPPEVEKVFETWASETEQEKLNFYKDQSYEEVRYMFAMKSELSKPFPNAPMPEGLETRPVKVEHYRKIWEAMDEAFLDHWGAVEGTEEDYQRFLTRIKENPESNPDLWQVAWDEEEVAGMVLNMIPSNENKELERLWGWTDPICVRRPWRKRGLAKALIIKSMGMLKEIGMEHAALGVDTKNPSGALNLYKSCGFEEYQTWVSLRKPLE